MFKSPILLSFCCLFTTFCEGQEIKFKFDKKLGEVVDMSDTTTPIGTFVIMVRNVSGKDMVIFNVPTFNGTFKVQKKRHGHYISLDSLCGDGLRNPLYPSEGLKEVSLKNNNWTELRFTDPEISCLSQGDGEYRIRYIFKYKLNELYHQVDTKWFYYRIVNTEQRR